MNKTELYRKYEQMIWNKVHLTHFQTGLDKNDLFAQANLIFVQAYEKYDSSRKVDFSTFLYLRLNWEMIKYINKKLKNSCILSEDISSILDKQMSCENLYIPKIQFEELSKDAKVILSIIFEEIPRDVRRITREFLYKYIRRTKNWKRKRILFSFNEIKHFLREQS